MRTRKNDQCMICGEWCEDVAFHECGAVEPTTPEPNPKETDMKPQKFPGAEELEAAVRGWNRGASMRGGLRKGLECALNSYRTRTGIDLADVSEKLASGEWVLAPAKLSGSWSDTHKEMYLAMLGAR